MGVKHLERAFGSSYLQEIDSERIEKYKTDRSSHDLRHTFASYLAMNGCNLKTIQSLM